MGGEVQTRPQGEEWLARERRIGELATRQHGVVARRQLVALGFGERQIESRLRAGRLRALQRDVYAVGHGRVSQHGYWLAAVLACGEGAVLSHGAAAALWGLQRFRGRIDVTAGRGRQGRPGRRGVRLHRGRLFAGDTAVQAGIPVTDVARTLFDQAEFVSFERLRRLAAEADRLHYLRVARLEALCETGRGRRALKPIKRLLADLPAPDRTRSPLEQRFAEFCEAQRLPPPATNVLVHGREVDALWPRAQLIAELDSFEFHAHRAAFEADRARDTRLLIAGYRTIRVTHRRLDEPLSLAAEIRVLLGSEAA